MELRDRDRDLDQRMIKSVRQQWRELTKGWKVWEKWKEWGKKDNMEGKVMDGMQEYWEKMASKMDEKNEN